MRRTARVRSAVARRRPNGLPVQRAAATTGALFGLLGLLGFLPGLTVHFESLAMAGHHSTALLLGVFSVSVLHNVIHLSFAMAGLILARKPLPARMFLIVAGMVYLALAGYGWLIDPTSAANVLPANLAVNWLHVVLGVGMLGLSALPGRTRDRWVAATGEPAHGEGG